MIRQVGLLGESNGEFLKMWQVQVDPATRLLREHRHINFEVALILDGYGQYHTSSGVHPMAPGDVFIFSGNEPHCITRILEGGLTILNLHFNWQLFSRCCSVARDAPNMFFAHSKDFSNRITGSARLEQLVKEICRELTEQQPCYEGAVDGLLNMIFLELIRSHGYYDPKEGSRRAIDRILEGVRFIDENFTQDITLEQIAEKCGITPNYFTKLFRECFQVKLWDYITAKRIDRAKGLLSGTQELNVLDIALQCGFNNTANFNRAFLKFTGITPSAYRHRRELLH